MFLLAVAFSIAHAPAAGAASGANANAEKNHGEQLAAARAFAAEKSWALARDAYAAAAKLAPDAEAKRWCELWQAQAEWLAADSGDWSAQRDFKKKIDTWIAPYRANKKADADDRGALREKDEF